MDHLPFILGLSDDSLALLHFIEKSHKWHRDTPPNLFDKEYLESLGHAYSRKSNSLPLTFCILSEHNARIHRGTGPKRARDPIRKGLISYQN